MQILPVAVWTARRDRHRRTISALIEPHLRRRGRGEAHPVIDFLFTYYSHRPAQLLRWHPGPGIRLIDAPEHARWRGYRHIDGGTELDPSFACHRRSAIEHIAALLAATAARPPQLSCFGLHEWAMVYRTEPVRHPGAELRLGRAGTDRVVESMQLRCTHFDAFRFFTAAAEPRNATALTRAGQVAAEQPGCLHATMDLYKHCYKLSPLIDSALTAACFELAYAARELDMRASPYQLTELGYPPIPIETAAGRAEYVRAQAELTRRAAPLRAALHQRCTALLRLADRADSTDGASATHR
ncbi:3-methyladenine DNA glycosylase [Skermania piniformis]|uniref:3-methyladenine DNA glycosylase n=1 Tax=Skermania pinensis TaxID=39122 RepID=A0ABX8S613_9ACTN|nr:3-methyladenine DNA glycosylase [Skermania piniformis]QXQ12452.1 3-methyladenine DNA glycosylase [Skermania piniformis]